ncbi:MAG: PDDEXK nuclease domain-containing protein [Melioribacteraceae bacterium]|nr:PDDEXK nuclease domain-containing protein [Melioribacteraceae bacterium]MCF8354088.1 PDDEXK nuclease domain-containing protein [Melioribacteraceae bacterium]MCF8393760.1 PDDEXK nuclease domain-containing protein [Melioribacteraceae bacterium]MCF8419504.1 PDDEXK nuclease domain-containing protein [Melioribacteraceae bacterium]
MDNFKNLVSAIQHLHKQLQQSAVNAVNQMLTIRNWMIGYYIVEFEQKGKDRAEYGDRLIESIAVELMHIKGIDKRSLFRFRQFYLYYPQIAEAIRGSLTPILPNLEKVGTVTPLLPGSQIVGSVTPQLETGLFVPGDKILTKLSYTHIEQLLGIDEPLKRCFYETECIKGAWSVRELKRQINSMYYERSGLSGNPGKLAKLVQQKIKPQESTDIIKNIYAFEFLDLPIKEIVEESDLEKALLDNLQHFIIELGYGFCFETRQRRILIGDKYYFIDLVFYHRILKCHVLIDLKIGEFEHGDIGQLNTYLNYFKEEISETEDNPPVGILLAAEKDRALVKYATAGMDKNLFVQQYMLKLPDAKILQQHIEKELNEF